MNSRKKTCEKGGNVMFKRKFAVLALIAALITTSFAVAGCSSQLFLLSQVLFTALQTQEVTAHLILLVSETL